MSQRLYIGKPEHPGNYDCVIDGDLPTRDLLLKEWFHYDRGSYVGPWKIIIGDIDLFRRLRFLIEECFDSVHKPFPESVWLFRKDNYKLEHPSGPELDSWLQKVA